MNDLLFILVISMSLTPDSLGQTDEDLLKFAKDGFQARANEGGLTNKKDAVPAFRKPFEGLTNAQKIKSLVLFLYDIDLHDKKWSMSARITMGPIDVLRADPNLVEDWSELKRMLRNEKNPRKFYLLSKIAPWSNDKQKHDFIAERSHMLFADGRVAKEEGEYTKPYAHDVSEYAYTAIIGNLRALKADFELSPEHLSHEEQAIILAKWLKENWHGCENIKIPPRLLGENLRSKPRKSLTQEEGTSFPRKAVTSSKESKKIDTDSKV